MDFELQHTGINCYEQILDTTVFQEETQEAIVPDASPDILRILDARACVFLTGKQAREDVILVTGLIRTSVFYLPDGMSGLRRLDISTPFTCQADARGVTPQGTVLAFPTVRWADARLLNPRKILLRVDLAVGIHAWQPQHTELCCNATAGNNVDLQQLHTNESCAFVSVVQEKPFTFSDTVDFGSFHNMQTGVLNIHGTAQCQESRLIGNKLIFKGTVELDVLLCAESDVKVIRHSMPYSQIMEVPGLGDNCSCDVRVVLTDLVFQPEDSATGGGMLTLELLAQAIVLEHRNLILLSDLYSTSNHMDIHTESHTLCRLMEQSKKSISVRELLETTTPVRTVIYGWADLGEQHTQREGERIDAALQVQINVIYLDDAEQFQSIHKTIPVSCTTDGAEGQICRYWSCIPTDLTVVPTAGGLEIRFTQDFHCITSQNCQTKVVSTAQLGEERIRNEQTQPSVILRLAAPGEQLWDIAKQYITTEEDIMQANELEVDALPTGKMLLIPRRR